MTFWTRNRREWLSQFVRGTAKNVLVVYVAIGVWLGSTYVWAEKWNKDEPGYHPRNWVESVGFIALMTVAWPVIDVQD